MRAILSFALGSAILPPADAIEPLAVRIQSALAIPDDKATDAAHLAFAVHYRVDYLLTWNCAHLASPAKEQALAEFVRMHDLWQPVICTPEDMSEEDDAP